VVIRRSNIMNVKMEKLEKNIIKLEITVEAKRFNEALKKSCAKNSRTINIPGFRKGKAPMNIIKKFYGEGVFFEDAINFCCDDTYPEALKQYDINPLDYPQIDIIEIGEGKDFVYTASVAVIPEVQIGEYKGLEVKKTEYNVTDDEIENQLKGMQEKNAASSNASRVTTIGSLPTNSGINPNFNKSPGIIDFNSSPTFFSSFDFISAPKPTEVVLVLFSIILSSPSKAPPQINKIFAVFI